MRKCGTSFLRIPAVILPVLVAVLALSSISPIYNFSSPEPFGGPDIFNPYAALDTTIGWKRACFHTHTRVKGPVPPNECELWPVDVLADYRKFGYDILTFSNHNELTAHPSDTSLQVNVYEHGYNILKYHKLVFGCADVWRFDHLLPLLPSQRQWQLDMLGRNCDFIQLNHPSRTGGSTKAVMRRLTGYRIMELDSGVTVEQEYWDWALSAGHYSFALANDDCHDTRSTDKIAVRCNWLNVPSGRYRDLHKTLLDGCYYCMRVPDFGGGDWNLKYEGNRHLPALKDVELHDSVVTVILSRPADYAEAIGQNHVVKSLWNNADTLRYVFPSAEPYVRFTAFFDDGTVIYSNPFAHYDKSVSETPYVEAEHGINWLLTVLFNLFLLAVVSGSVWLAFRLVRKR